MEDYWQAGYGAASVLQRCWMGNSKHGGTHGNVITLFASDFFLYG
jgi:hypothetical protein